MIARDDGRDGSKPLLAGTNSVCRLAERNDRALEQPSSVRNITIGRTTRLVRLSFRYTAGDGMPREIRRRRVKRLRTHETSETTPSWTNWRIPEPSMPYRKSKLQCPSIRGTRGCVRPP